MNGTGIILQARMGSARLPGKSLALLNGRTLLAHCVHRLSHSGFPLVVATTDRAEDDAVDRAARALGVEVYRGSAEDVLARFVGAAERFQFADVIRATGDNPFVDLDTARRTSLSRQRASADHAIECGLPVGAAVEAISFDALVQAERLATDPYDREHVTSLVRRESCFRVFRAMAPAHLRRSALRLTVDTAEDLALAREIFAVLGPDNDMPTLSAIIAAADSVLLRSVVIKRTRKGA